MSGEPSRTACQSMGSKSPQSFSSVDGGLSHQQGKYLAVKEREKLKMSIPKVLTYIVNTIVLYTQGCTCTGAHLFRFTKNKSSSFIQILCDEKTACKCEFTNSCIYFQKPSASQRTHFSGIHVHVHPCVHVQYIYTCTPLTDAVNEVSLVRSFLTSLTVKMTLETHL